MADDSSEWQFSVEDVTPTETSTDSSPSNTSSDGRSVGDTISGTGLTLLPLTVLAVYAFVKEGVVLAAIEGLIGETTLALALTDALWIGGAVTVAGFGLVALIAVVGLLVGVVKRSGAAASVGAVAGLFLAVLYGGAVTIFSELPVLVGAILTFTAIIYGGVILIGGLAILVAITQL